jgi:hypothetical protein
MSVSVFKEFMSCGTWHLCSIFWRELLAEIGARGGRVGVGGRSDYRDTIGDIGSR